MLNRLFINLLKICAATSFLSLILVVFYQAFARKFLPSSPSWTEEISRFLFIYSITFAAPVAWYYGDFIRVGFILDRLPNMLQKLVESVWIIIITIFFCIIGFYGLQYASLGMYQTAPASGVKMVIPYSSVLIISVLMALVSIIKLVQLWCAKQPQFKTEGEN